eukprot:4079808-Prymnesium_polylepis.1
MGMILLDHIDLSLVLQHIVLSGAILSKLLDLTRDLIVPTRRVRVAHKDYVLQRQPHTMVASEKCPFPTMPNETM